MEVDARQIEAGTTLEADVCVVGAGPAGLALARGLCGRGLRVLVLESGGERSDPAIEALGDGDVVGDAYAGLAATRSRGIGGTARIWNTLARGSVSAKCVPLDRVDLAPRSAEPLRGWPFDWDELAPWYARGRALCGLAELPFDAETADAARRPFPGLGAPLVSRAYRLASREALLGSTVKVLRAADDVRLVSHATAIGLETARHGERIRAAEVGTPGGPRWIVVADRFVLAAGAVENARLLLVSGARDGGLGNGSGWVGRCFMEHPRDATLVLRPRTPDDYRAAGFYDLHTAPDGTPVLGRLALAEAAVRDGRLPNASGTLLARVRPGVERVRRALGPVAAWRGVRRILPAGGHGWSEHPFPQRVFDGWTLLLNLEQAPHPENRIRLGSRRDAFDTPVAELHWRWREEDRAGLERVRLVFAAAMEASRLFHVALEPDTPPDPNAHHHAGTTRMHRDPAWGVVDATGRVHGVENLYVTGASVFPTAGFANPLLTILALATRLSEHLAPAPRTRGGTS